MTLSKTRLQWRLNRPFKYFDRVESTNDIAKAWLLAGASEGAVVIADQQMRGRGRKGREWQTPPNAAIALSVILKPEPACLPRLNMVAALSVCDLARACGCADVGLKWPNDALVNGLKVGGILPEAIWEGDQLRGAILGIGVNVRVDFRGGALQDIAVSLEEVVAHRLDRADLIATLLRRLDCWYARIASPALISSWKAQLQTLNQAVSIAGLSGVAVDATDDGALLIRDARGTIHQAGAGELVIHAEEERR